MLKKIFNIIEENKERIAYKINNDEITYGDLLINATGLAKALKSQGTSPVILYGHKSLNMVISILACLIANRAYVPIDLHVPIERLKNIIKMTKSTLIIKNEKIDIEGIESLSIEDLCIKYKEFEEYDTSKNDIAYIIFTSGSTGEPKGVPISYGNLENFTKWISDFEYLNSYSKINVLNQASFSFDLSVADLYYSLYNGHTLIGLDKASQENYDKIFDVIKEEKINFMVMTPTFVKMLLLNEVFNDENYSEIKCMYFCGEQLEVSTVKKIKEKFKNIIIINAYGPTEATSAVSAIVIEDEMLNKDFLPIGKIETSATEIVIESDEIVLKGSSVFSGYLGDISGGYYKENEKNCYKTGDFGYIEDGLLYCKGRFDNQIKYKGYRIELGDIENNLLKIDGIKEAVVVAKDNKDSGIVKLIKAYITVGKEIEIDSIKNTMRCHLPEYMIPKKIEILEKIPVNENGKYDRKKLKEL